MSQSSKLISSYSSSNFGYMYIENKWLVAKGNYMPAQWEGGKCYLARWNSDQAQHLVDELLKRRILGVHHRQSDHLNLLHHRLRE